MRVPLLWRLAPGVLFRFPRSAAAVAFSAGVVVLATILGPLFLASSERASLRTGIESGGRWEAGLQIVWRPHRYPKTEAERARFRRLAEEGRRALTERVAEVPGVEPAVTTLLGGPADGMARGDETPVRLVYRTGAFDNVKVVEEGGPGVWISDITAESLGIGPGDTISFRTPAGTGRARVGSVYRALREDRPRAFWTSLTDFIYKQPEADGIPPPFVLADLDFVTSADRTAQIRWNLPLESTDLPPDAIRDIGREFQRITAETLGQSSPIGELLRELGGFALEPDVQSLLPGIVDTARDRLEASQAPAGVVTVTARLLGAGLMVAAGLSLVARRRSEVRAMIGRGESPAALAARFSVEGLPLVVAGACAGIAAGWAGVRLLGAAGGVGLSYVGGLAGDAALAAAAALALLAVSTGAAVLREERSFSARSSTWGRMLPLVAGAAVAASGVLSYRALEDVSVTDADEALGGSILLAPIGLIAAGALVAGVALRLALPFVAGAARRRSTGVFLAARRLAAGSGMTHTLVVLCGSALGVMFFGLTVAGSVHTTATAKAKTFVGSDLAVGVAPNPPALPDLPFPAGHVTKLGTYLEGTAQPVTVLGIDPDTFEEAAFWDDEFADESLGDLIAQLDDDGTGPVPAVVAGFPEGVTPALAGGEVPLEVVARADAFPGMTPEQPLVATTIDSVRRLIVGGVSGTKTNEIWAKGSPDEIELALLEAGQAAFAPLTADAVLDSPTLQSLVWSLGLLGGVGALASLTAVAGLALYLQARHTAAQVTAAMTRRMGIGRRAEMLSWTAEIAGAGVASFAVGAATGLVTAFVVHERVDVQPDLAPKPIFAVPTSLVLATGVAVALVAGVTARRLQRRMDATPVGEIMRV